MQRSLLLSLATLAFLCVGRPSVLAQTAVTIPGLLKFEAFTGIPNTPIQGLYDDPNFIANKPAETLYLTSFDTRTVYPNDSHDNFGARISGFVTPTETGEYEFFLRSDDASELYFNSRGTDFAQVEKIAEELGCCNAFMEPGSTQTSVPIALTAGRAYAIQAFYKEGGGGDFCQVAWRKVGDTTPPAQLLPIPAAYLSASMPAGGTITITKQPTAVTAAQNDYAKLSVDVTVSGGPVLVQWQKNGVTLPNVTGLNVTIGPLTASDNGAQYRALISIPGATATSDAATFTVGPDVTKPTIRSVTGSRGFDALTVVFSEAVTAASAGVASNYTLDGGLTVSSATVIDGTTVRLATSRQTSGGTYTLTIRNIADVAGNTSADGASLQFPAFGPVRGGLLLETFNNLPGAGAADLQNLIDSDAFKNNQSDFTAYVTQFTSRLALPDNQSGLANRENYGGRLSGWIVPTETAEYEFFIRSDDASQLFLNPTGESPDGAQLIAQENDCCDAFEEPGAGDNGDGTFPTSAPILLTAGKRYYIAAVWKEGGGGDYCDVAWRKRGAADLPRALPYISGNVLETLGAPGVLTAPSVTFLRPAAGASLPSGSAVTLEAAPVAGSGKTIVRVDFVEQGRVIGSATSSPYTLTLFGVADGNHTYIARAVDSAGLMGDSTPLDVGLGAPEVVVPIVVIDDKTLWRYDRTGNDYGTAWKEKNFDDSAWPQGKALIADETTTTVEPIRTAISRLNDAGEYVQTFYFRYKFNFDRDMGAGAKLKLRHVVDDGAVVYLNGTEIHRFGIGAGVEFDYKTSFGGHENAYEGPFDVPPTLLVKGENVLAVEVHQSGGSSSDMVFGAELIATVPCVVKDVALVKIDDATTWRYDRTGNDYGTAWKEKGFDDAAWPQGKTLIADETTTTVEPIRTPISRLNDAGEYVQTFYFRTHFNFQGDKATAKFKLRHVVDDGAVIYLNGTEIHRFGIGAGVEFDYKTSFAGHENAYEGPVDVSPDLVVVGDNVLAVEVHQSGGSSSDMVFGAELIATVVDCGGGGGGNNNTPPVMTIARSGANVVISWTEGGTLVSADTVKGTYTAVPNVTGTQATLPIGSGAKFYRVQR